MQKKLIFFSLVVVGVIAAGALYPLIGRVSLPKASPTKVETVCLCPSVATQSAEFSSSLTTATPMPTVEVEEASKAGKKVIKVTPMPTPDLLGVTK